MMNLSSQVTVSDMMTPSPKIVLPNTSLRHVFKLMKAIRCRHLPVVESSKVVGIITDRDLRLALNEPSMDTISWGSDSRLDRLKTEMFMSVNPKMVESHKPAREAAELLTTFKIGALPVVDNERLVGIVTTSDFLNYIIQQKDKVTS